MKNRQNLFLVLFALSLGISSLAAQPPWMSPSRTATELPGQLPSMAEYPHFPYLVKNPGPEYADDQRMFQGIPGLAVSPGGRLWATWYTGGEGEGQDNYVVLVTSGNDGRTWSDPVMSINPPFRASEPMLWVDPQGTLWFVFNLYPVRSSARDREHYKENYGDVTALNQFVQDYNFVATQLWVMTTGNPDDEDPVWSEPRLLAMETHVLNKPTVLSDGTWLWPATPLISPRNIPVRPLYSSDGGDSFFYRGVMPILEGRSADEYQVVERKDGSWWLLNRASYGIGESFSTDQGETWSPMAPSSIVHTVSRFFITRLQSGNLLLVKHGPIDKDVRRSQLMAFVSRDDGQTWEGGLMLDERQGNSYPDGVQVDDGRIYIIYDYRRHHDKEILMAIFTEEDALAGEAISGKTRFRQLVNKATLRNTRYDKPREEE